MTASREKESVADIPRPIFLQPHLGESLLGFIFRLADNERCSPADIREWLGWPRKLEFWLEPSEHAARLLRLNIRDLLKMGIHRPGLTTISVVDVPSHWVSNRVMRYCPSCLEQNLYHRRIWDFNILAVCPLHRIKLKERCPSPDCNRLQFWSDTRSLGMCECGTSLLIGTRTAVEEGCLSAEILYQRFGIGVESKRFPSEIQNLSIRDFVELISFLGQVKIKSMGAKVTMSRKPARKKHYNNTILDEGAKILLDWPRGFYSLCMEINHMLKEKKNFHTMSRLHKIFLQEDGILYRNVLRNPYRQFLEIYGRPRFHGNSMKFALDASSSFPSVVPMVEYGENKYFDNDRPRFKIPRGYLWPPIPSTRQEVGWIQAGMEALALGPREVRKR